MSVIDSVMKTLQDRSHDLERQRTRALATGKWPKVIETEARMDENSLLQSKVIDLAKELNKQEAINAVESLR